MNKYNKIAKKWYNRFAKSKNRSVVFYNSKEKNKTIRAGRCYNNYLKYLDLAIKSGDYSFV